MKPFTITIGLLFLFLTESSLNAQRIYTWTDKNGVVNLSHQPPPETDRVDHIEVMKYDEKTPQEIEAIQRRREKLRRRLAKEEQLQKARQAEIQAGEAEERSRKAVQQALKQYEYNNEYIRRLTSTQNKRKKFKKRVERLKAKTEASLAEAQAAVEKAEKAAQRAGTAAEEAQKDQQKRK